MKGFALLARHKYIDCWTLNLFNREIFSVKDKSKTCQAWIFKRTCLILTLNPFEIRWNLKYPNFLLEPEVKYFWRKIPCHKTRKGIHIFIYIKCTFVIVVKITVLNQKLMSWTQSWWVLATNDFKRHITWKVESLQALLAAIFLSITFSSRVY